MAVNGAQSLVDSLAPGQCEKYTHRKIIKENCMLFLSFHVFLSLLIFEVEKAGCVSEFVPLLHR